MRTLTALLAFSVAAAAADPKLVVKPDAFATLVNPNCSHCVDEAKRRKDEREARSPLRKRAADQLNMGRVQRLSWMVLSQPCQKHVGRRVRRQTKTVRRGDRDTDAHSDSDSRSCRRQRW